MQSHTMELSDGRVLSWSELGASAPANLLVHHHGTGSSRLELQIYDELLSEMGVRVIAPERPGSGCSTGGEHPRTVAVWADDIVSLVEHLHIDEFAVGGFSGGGPHALAVAASPELAGRVTSVLLRAALAPGQPPRNPYDVEIRRRAHHVPWSEFPRVVRADGAAGVGAGRPRSLQRSHIRGGRARDNRGREAAGQSR